MKRIFLFLLVLSVLLFSGCGRETADESAEETVDSEQERSISLSPLPADVLGAAAHLIEEDFILNEDNIAASLGDFFDASCALDFYLEDGDGGIYRCNNPALNRKFGEIFCRADYKVISMRKYDAVVAHGSVEDPYWEASYLRGYFANAAGEVSVIVGRDGTCIDFYRAVAKENEMNESGRTFFTEADLFSGLLEVKEAILHDCTRLE